MYLTIGCPCINLLYQCRLLLYGKRVTRSHFPIKKEKIFVVLTFVYN